MEIRIYSSKDKLLVQLAGRVVLDECDRLKSAVVPRIAPGIGQVVLDLGKVDFIDSAGLGALVGMKVSANKNRARLTLAAPSKSVSDILLVSKLDSIFEILNGADAQALVASLARPEFLAKDEGMSALPSTVSSPTFQAPPNMPTVSASMGSLSMSPATSSPGTSRDQIEDFCRQAVEHMRNREYEKAVECYEQALKLDPEYITALNNMAIVLEKKPQWRDRAIKQWQNVMRLSTARGDQKHIERAQKHLDALQ